MKTRMAFTDGFNNTYLISLDKTIFIDMPSIYVHKNPQHRVFGLLISIALETTILYRLLSV